MQVNNGETMRQMVLAGAGIARLGLWHVKGNIELGDLVPLLEKFNPGDPEMVNAVYVGGGSSRTGSAPSFDHTCVEIVRASSLFKGS